LDSGKNIIDRIGLDNKYNKYLVNDIFGDDCSIIFILESPHKKEVIHKHPAAEATGSILSNLIFKKFNNKRYPPLGYLIKKYPKHDRLTRFGILNVCNIPMDKNAYACTDIKLIICILDCFKKNIQSNSKVSKSCLDCLKNEEKKKLINDIKEDFAYRLCEKVNEVKDKNVLLIPCGKVARFFLGLIIDDKNNQINGEEIKKSDFKIRCNGKTHEVNIISGIPHPASRGKKKFNKDITDKLKKIISEFQKENKQNDKTNQI